MVLFEHNGFVNERMCTMYYNIQVLGVLLRSLPLSQMHW